jgi:hypothetical protein
MTLSNEQPSQGALNYLAHVLRRMTDAATTDPLPVDFARLNGKPFEIVMNVLSEGRDKAKRKSRIAAELMAHGLDLILLPMIDAADPQAELDKLAISQNTWKAFDLVDVLQEPRQPLSWIVKYFVPKPCLVVVYGKPKSKKTLITLDLALHIAGGRSWMKSAPNAEDGIEVKPARVVWVNLENPTNLFRGHMIAFASDSDNGFARGTFHAYSMPEGGLDLSKPENVTLMIERIRSFGDIGVMIIDHLSLTMGDIDENSSLASKIMQALRVISETCDLSIIVIHHAKKTTKDGGLSDAELLRGSGALLAGVDAAFMVETDLSNKNIVTFKPVALRGPDAPIISANFVYTQDENLELTTARFERIPYKSKSARAKEAVLEALKQNDKLNHTGLRAEAKRLDKSLSDANIREAISSLEGAGDIFYRKADKGAKLYSLSEDDDHEEDD